MDLEKLYQTYSRIRENQATPRQMLKIVIYGYMNSIYSSRKLESSCKRGINFMYLLEVERAPAHSTIACFRTCHLAQVSKDIMASMTHFLSECGEISLKSLFIDGTKIEASANKYTFVWKKSVDKNLKKMMDKIPNFVAKAEKLFGIRVIYNNRIELRHLKKLHKKLKKI